jgi:hypothetical protein
MAIALVAGGAQASVPEIVGTATSLSSTVPRMISYRNQQHSWQTSDGAIHIMINRGLLKTGASLSLYSSFDGGNTWTSMFSLGKTDGTSTSDGILTNTAGGAVLQLVYATNAATQSILYTTATYDAAAHTWTAVLPQTVFATAGVQGFQPALSADSDGNLWCAFTSEDLTSELYEIQMAYEPAGSSTWQTTGLVFGSVDNSTQHAGRTVPLPNGVGMIYQIAQTMYWAYRQSGQPITTPWVTSTLDDGLPDTDPYDTHYSVVADSSDNLYLTFSGSSHLLFQKYTSATSSWGSAIELTPTVDQSAYMQVGIAGGNVVVVANDLEFLEVFQSTDGGASFTVTYALVHKTPTLGSTLNYEYPRVEMPTYATGTLPVWQQFTVGVDAITNELLFFTVPLSN